MQVDGGETADILLKELSLTDPLQEK